MFIVFCTAGCAKKTLPMTTSDDCEWNESKAFRLCIQDTTDAKSKMKTISYSLYSRENEVIKKGVITAGYVRWLNESAIEIFEPPGVIREGVTKEQLTDVFLIDSKETISKEDYLSRVQK